MSSADIHTVGPCPADAAFALTFRAHRIASRFGDAISTRVAVARGARTNASIPVWRDRQPATANTVKFNGDCRGGERTNAEIRVRMARHQDHSRHSEIERRVPARRSNERGDSGSDGSTPKPLKTLRNATASTGSAIERPWRFGCARVDTQTTQDTVKVNGECRRSERTSRPIRAWTDRPTDHSRFCEIHW